MIRGNVATESKLAAEKHVYRRHLPGSQIGPRMKGKLRAKGASGFGGTAFRNSHSAGR